MKNTLTYKLVLVGIVACGIALALILSSFFTSLNVRASAPSGLPATVATSSTAAVGTTAALIFATSTCSSRTITASSTAIMITFTDYQGAIPSAIVGTRQLASTTKEYDSGQYGCGAVRVWSPSAETIGLVEAR